LAWFPGLCSLVARFWLVMRSFSAGTDTLECFQPSWPTTSSAGNSSMFQPWSDSVKSPCAITLIVDCCNLAVSTTYSAVKENSKHQHVFL
jgi:hypothetical protein